MLLEMRVEIDTRFFDVAADVVAFVDGGVEGSTR
jgi:hypothetical protein